MYLLRFDDASEYMDTDKWNMVEQILDKYRIKPLVGVIPNNQDPSLVKYKKDKFFWDKVKIWENKGWKIAMHGYNHVYNTTTRTSKSEFVDINIEIQKEKIRKGLEIFNNNKIDPEVFFAPSHTFDHNTLKALKEESKIRIISDTVAFDVYKKDDFYYVPQQIAYIRSVPFMVATFCYHPNTMDEAEFDRFEKQISKYKKKIVAFDSIILKDRKLNIADWLLAKSVFWLRKIKTTM